MMKVVRYDHGHCYYRDIGLVMMVMVITERAETDPQIHGLIAPVARCGGGGRTDIVSSNTAAITHSAVRDIQQFTSPFHYPSTFFLDFERHCSKIISCK